MNNLIGGEPKPIEEQLLICKRLYVTHTKSSAGGVRCKSADPLTPQGYGMKMLPIIDGLEGRFRGKSANKNKCSEVADRLHRAKTASVKSRADYPRILLWPERTLVGGSVERVKQYHDSGLVTKQALLERREKWYL